MNENETMGKRIAALRKRAGLTQEQLAGQLGVSPQAVSKWENDGSCPDISLLPQLAATLGVSVDELLGVSPPKGAAASFGSAGAGDNTIHNNKKEKKSSPYRGEAIATGVLLLVLGAAFLLSNSGVLILPNGIGLWELVWPAVVMGLGISWTVKHFNVFSLAVALVGFYFLLVNLNVIENQLTWSVIWPVLLVLLGISIIFHAFTKRSHGYGKSDFAENHEEKSFTDNDGHVYATCKFGEEKWTPTGALLQSGDFSIAFGSMTIDLTSFSDIADGAVINVNVSFGELKLILPDRVDVQTNISHSFAGGTDKHEYINPDRRIFINGSVSFGDLKLNYR